MARPWSALVLIALAACDPASSSRSDASRSDSVPSDAGAPPPPSATALWDLPGYDPQWRAPSPLSSPREADTDPLGGPITLAQATADLPGEGPLVAHIETSMGALTCTLMPERAPRAVAQFVGLANGTRPFRTRRGWVAKPAYDGSRIHRVVPGALIVGGRPPDAHPDGIGLVTVAEPWPGMRHDEAGLLCSAARGALGAGELLLTGAHAAFGKRGEPSAPLPTVFGRCEPAALAERMTHVASEHGRPREAIVLQRIRVKRGRTTGDADDAGK